MAVATLVGLAMAAVALFTLASFCKNLQKPSLSRQ
jgi:hypothetical protein